MKALVYHGPGERGWDTVDDPTIIDADRRDRPHRHLDDLRHRPAHPQRRRARDDPGTILGHEAVGTVHEVGAGVSTVAPRRPRAAVLRELVRALPLLQGGPLRPVPGRRRLDLRPPDQRPAGRVRARPVRRQLGLQGPRGAQRRAGAVPRRHPAHLLRGRRAQRHGLTRRRRRDRRRRTDRPGGDPHREALHARADRRDRPRRQPPARARSASAPTSRSTTAARTRSRR